MMGPGRYDEECTALREKTKAEGAVVIIINGEKGLGFSVQAPIPVLLTLPSMLRAMAEQIEKDMFKGVM